MKRYGVLFAVLAILLSTLLGSAEAFTEAEAKKLDKLVTEREQHFFFREWDLDTAERNLIAYLQTREDILDYKYEKETGDFFGELWYVTLIRKRFLRSNRYLILTVYNAEGGGALICNEFDGKDTSQTHF